MLATASQLPSRVISELIGVDPADREEIRKTIDLTLGYEKLPIIV